MRMLHLWNHDHHVTPSVLARAWALAALVHFSKDDIYSTLKTSLMKSRDMLTNRLEILNRKMVSNVSRGSIIIDIQVKIQNIKANTNSYTRSLDDPTIHNQLQSHRTKHLCNVPSGCIISPSYCEYTLPAFWKQSCLWMHSTQEFWLELYLTVNDVPNPPSFV